MKFLHLLSTEASHSVTLRCLKNPHHGTTLDKNPIGSAPNSLDRIKFRGWNKQLFEKDTLLDPHVISNEQEILHGRWLQTQFLFSTQDSRQLPIVDILDFPTSNTNSQQEIENGPVCFL
uniref:Fibrillar collagen NC1 domain-containing protein n=2 Tax=Periophthalmus magnuspinnatus TaxID=409849 RepID=A0A3B4A8A0_9GOBI